MARALGVSQPSRASQLCPREGEPVLGSACRARSAVQREPLGGPSPSPSPEVGAAAGPPREGRGRGDVGASSRWAWSVDKRRSRSRSSTRGGPTRCPPLALTHRGPGGAGLLASREGPWAGGAWGARAAASSRLQLGRLSCARRGLGAHQSRAPAQPGAGLLRPGRRRKGRGGVLVGTAGIRSRFRRRLGQRGRGLGGPGAGGGAWGAWNVLAEGSGGGGQLETAAGGRVLSLRCSCDSAGLLCPGHCLTEAHHAGRALAPTIIEL